MISQLPAILIAEDDDNDALLLQRTLRKICPTVAIQIVVDGEKAIQYLAGSGKYADRSCYPFPDVVMTDIKMPQKSGFEVLDWIKHNTECRVIPIIVWSSSAEESDVVRAYELGANCYFQKPLSQDWEETVKLIVNFWKAARIAHLKSRINRLT